MKKLMNGLFGIMGLLGFSMTLQAAIIVVNSNEDVVAADAECTLREALVAANLDVSYEGCTAGNFDDVIILFLEDTGILLESTLHITDGVDIIGTGAENLVIKPAVGNEDVLFEIDTTRSVELEGFRMTSAKDGAIKVLEVNKLTLESMLFFGNSGVSAVWYRGSGVSSNPSNALKVHNTTFNNNSSAIGAGGAIRVDGEIDVDISDSVFTNNSATAGFPYGGAIYIGSPDDYTFSGNEVRISNSEFSENVATYEGAVAYIIGDMPVHIENSQFSGNQSTNYRSVLTISVNFTPEHDTYQPFTITASAFTSNQGYPLRIGSKPTEISQSLFLNNETDGGAGTIETFNNNVLMQNNVVADNTLKAGSLSTSSQINFRGSETVNTPLLELDLQQNTFTNNETALLNVKSYPDSPTQINMANNLFNQAALTDDCFTSDTSSTIVSLGGNVHYGSGDCAPGVNDFPGADIGLLSLAEYGGVVPSMPLKPDSPWLDQFSCTGDDFSGEGRPRDGDGNGVSLCDLGAVESPDAHKLTVNFTGDGAGDIDLFALDVDCGSSETACEWGITQNQTHTLTATPSAGSTFIQWGGACSGDTSCVVTMDAAKTVTAEFATVVNPIRLTTRKFANAPGLSATIVSAPAGIHCGRNCFADFVENDVVNLTAELGEDTVIDTWLGCDAISTNGVCKVVMGTSDVTIDLFLKQDPDIIFKDDFED